MDIRNLGRLVQQAIEDDPPAEIMAWCEDQYQPYYHLLYLLALHSDGACVELGVEKGRGSFAMALAGRQVHGFESQPHFPVMHLLRARFSNFHFHHRPSLPPPEDWNKPISVLHVDTEHSYAMAREEFNAWKVHLVPGAVVCFDDTHAQESAVGHFVTTLPWPTVFDDRLHSCGYAAMIYGEG